MKSKKISFYFKKNVTVSSFRIGEKQVNLEFKNKEKSRVGTIAFIIINCSICPSVKDIKQCGGLYSHKFNLFSPHLSTCIELHRFMS